MQVLAKLLTTCNRELFVQTCLFGTQYESAYHPLSKSSFPTIADWLWGTTSGFLRGLIPATGNQTFLVLRAAWDPNKFHERGLEQQTQRPGEEPLDCTKLSQVIRDNMCWHYAQMVVSLLGLTTSMMSWAQG